MMSTQIRDLRPADLKRLAAVAADPCVSILIPTEVAGRATEKGPIYLKNALDEAEKLLSGDHYKKRMMEELRPLVDDRTFWQHQGQGLAIFGTPEETQLFRLSHSVGPRVVVDRTFYLAPLIDSHAAHPYMVLALTWEDAHLWKVSDQGSEEIETEDLPARYAELVPSRDFETQVQDTSYQTSAGNRTVYYGQGSGATKIEADRTNYLSRVGHLVSAELYDAGLPLVLAATEEVAGHFQAVTEIPVDAKIAGSPHDWSHKELLDRAGTAMQSQLDADRDDFAERFGNALALDQATHDIDRALVAAMQGRVETLMIAQGAEAWGTVDDDRNGVHLSKERGAADIDLVNRAMLETLRTGGEVLSCPPKSMPTEGNVAMAIFRY